MVGIQRQPRPGGGSVCAQFDGCLGESVLRTDNRGWQVPVLYNGSTTAMLNHPEPVGIGMMMKQGTDKPLSCKRMQLTVRK